MRWDRNVYQTTAVTSLWSWSEPQCKGRKGLGGDVSYCVTAVPWQAPEMCPWNYVMMSLSIQLPLSSLRLAFCLLPSDLLTIAAGHCLRLCSLKCPEASQPQPRAHWHLVLLGTAEQTTLLPPLSWTYFKWRWCRTGFQKQGRSGSQLKLRVCSSNK